MPPGECTPWEVTSVNKISMETRIFGNGSYINVRPQDFVNTTRRMRSFAICNGFRDCIFKAQGGYYKLCLDGILVKVFDHLSSVSFEELYEVLKRS